MNHCYNQSQWPLSSKTSLPYEGHVEMDSLLKNAPTRAWRMRFPTQDVII